MAPSLMRRRLLLAVVAANFGSAARGALGGVQPRDEEPAPATLARLIGDAKPQVGRVEIRLPEIAESGNSVPLKVRVESPMTTADHVRAIHIVAERNPRPWVATFSMGPRAGKAEVETNIRLSDTQTVAAYAQMSDGSWWTQRVAVTVTIGACDVLGSRY
jgi:sulfur-oxidizing protein SoxY